jgi:hypothetical protein
MQKIKKAVLIILLSAPLLLFQNCTATSSGFGTGSGTGATTAGAVNSLLATKPMPLEMSINQISYMSCPAVSAATASTTSGSDPLANPFYRFRFGAFDNSYSNGFTNYIGANHVGGIGFTKDAMTYMKSISAIPNANMLSNYLKTSPYTAAATPVAAVIYRSRSTSSVAYTAMATPLLTSLNDPTLIATLVNQPVTANGSSLKTSFFSALDTVTGSLVGTMNQTNGSELQLRQSMASQFLFFGYAPTSTTTAADQMTANLIGPDNNVTKRLFGYGYSLNFGANNYVAQNGISEWSLNPANGFNPTLNTPAGSWDCFPLTVVRDIDRKYYTVETKTAYNNTTNTPITAPVPVAPAALQTIPRAPYYTIAGYAWNSYASATYYGPDPGTCPVAPFTTSGLPTSYQTYPFNPAPSPNSCLAIPNPLIPGQNAYLPSTAVVDPRVVGSALSQYGLLLPNQAVDYASAANGIRMNYFDSTVITGSTTIADIDDVMTQLANYYSQSDRGALLLGGATGGNFYACPPEDPSKMTAQQLERLRIARRFLLPDLWDINISQMCAVPTATTNSIGSCYNAGDTATAKIIQYDGIDGVSCGTSATGQTLNECPARISVCWRFK